MIEENRVETLLSFPVIIATCVVGGLLFLSTNTNAQSLKCEEASKPSEFQICNNEDLIVLDEAMAKAYVKKFISQPTLPQQQQVTKAHHAWLKKRDACNDNADCLIAQYGNRIAALKPVAVKSLSAFSPE